MTNTTHTAAQPLDLDKLEALARAATPGEWKAEPLHGGGHHNVGIRVRGPLVSGYAAALNTRWSNEAQAAEQEANAAYIAAANPDTILTLIAQARASQPEGATGTTGATVIWPSEKFVHERIATLMADIGMPDDTPLWSAFSRFEADLRSRVDAAPASAQPADAPYFGNDGREPDWAAYAAAEASAQPDRGAAHAQQEAAPAEVTKSQERDYNWLLGLAKSKGYHTVYGALYAAPTAVPYLGILPSHSEREAANAGGLTGESLAKLLAGKHVNDYGYRMLLNGEEIGFSLQDLLDIVKTASGNQSRATIAAGQEAANAKDAIATAYGYLWHVNAAYGAPPEAEVLSVTPERAAYEARKVLRDLLTSEQRGQGINSVRARLAAMAAVGAAGQEGGAK